MLFGWPSAFTVLGHDMPAPVQFLAYRQDQRHIEQAEPHIAAFIADILHRAHPDRLYIVAHSMGTRGSGCSPTRR